MASSLINSRAELLIRADVSELRCTSVWIEQACLERGVPANEIERLDVCLNEALANILAHGGSAALEKPINVRLEVHHDAPSCEAVVTVADSGAPFDPLAVAAESRPKMLAEATPGGLGLRMIRGFADILGYRYLDERNQLSFGVRWSACADDR